ncbi:MAG: HAD-IB family phosphatase [Pirellulaceae bacterium]|nr:HAD-IB family phosphatase [Pirellulaceae bacterium]
MALDVPERRAVLVSDFDGTLARPDFYHLVRQHLVPPGTPNFWDAYRVGKMTHFDALRSFFEAAEGGEAALRGILDMIEMPAQLADHLERLRAVGWDVLLVSAGCSWYIDILLARAGVNLPCHANPGRIHDGRLIMERPTASEYCCHETGIDKAAVVQGLLQQGRKVAFAGDGFPDFEAARLVASDLRFARSDLTIACRKADVPYRPFEDWSEVAAALLEEPA